MPDLAESAHALTDAAIGYLAARLPLIAGGAVALIGVIMTGLAWLCYEELRGEVLSSSRRPPV
jgi:hypothetical protein